MREILYLHTGTSYLAAQFFNTSQSYFDYDDDPRGKEDSKNSANDNVKVDHDISFQEGQARDGSIMYTPRAILVDYKSKFGSIANIDASGSGQVIGDEEISSTLWTGTVTSIRQDPIPRSSYHDFLDTEEDIQKDTEINEQPPRDFTSSISYWSDFSRVYYHPRGLYRLPDPADWERDVGWSKGIDKYRELEPDHGLLDDVFRLFAEECDLLQGLQLTLDAPSFGSFSFALLNQLRDEYPKLPILSFCALSSLDPLDASPDDVTRGIYILNDAMTLHGLASLSCQIIPLQHPSTWDKGPWCEDIVADFLNPYHSSALLSAHIESITLPLRLKQTLTGSSEMSTLISHLNWRNDTPFSALTGSFSPASMVSNIAGSEFDFSHPSSLHKDVEAVPFAQRSLYRGLDSSEERQVQEWIGEKQSTFREPFHSCTFIDIAYSIPSSYPQFFTNRSLTGRKILESTSDKTITKPCFTRVKSIPLYTSVRTTPRMGKLAKSYAQFIAGVAKRHTGVIEELGIERDAVRETGEDWWKWVGSYEGEEGDEEDERDIDEDD
ncbi:hypothetical protein Clacol_003546 [Clathrus columnatus]|uniref:Tubulin nucleotide-binding domain-like protein n=1 Tax=Clathrus columnatus TaxID=1419009 RepID=A0AAV5A9A7_9AGAM|nr:hypothetical protein Clacol_003546 [Clathrus columnatus]